MSQKGFSSILVGAIIIIAIFLVASGYYFKQQTVSSLKSTLTDKVERVEPKDADETGDWRTYVSLKYNYLIKYPLNFELDIITAGSAEPYDVVEIKSTNFSIGILPLIKKNDYKDLESYVREYLTIYEDYRITDLSHKEGDSYQAITVNVDWKNGSFRTTFLENNDIVFRIGLPEDILATQMFATFRFLNPTKDKELIELIESANAYIKSRSVPDLRFDVSLTRIAGNYALLYATPRYNKTDPAQIIMEKVAGRWEGRTMGTAFPEWSEKVPELFQ